MPSQEPPHCPSIREQAARVRPMSSIWDAQLERGVDCFLIRARPKPTIFEMVFTPILLTVFFNAVAIGLALLGIPLWKTHPTRFLITVYGVFAIAMLVFAGMLTLTYRHNRSLGVYSRGSRGADGFWSVESPSIQHTFPRMRPRRIRHLVGRSPLAGSAVVTQDASVVAIEGIDEHGHECSFVVLKATAVPRFIRRPKPLRALEQVFGVETLTARGLDLSLRADLHGQANPPAAPIP